MEHFGVRLKRFRDDQGWSQEQLGFELNVSKATVSKWESGQAQPRLESLAEIRALLARHGLSLDTLIEGLAGEVTGASSAGRRVRERATPYPAHAVRTAEEALLLDRFRALKPARRKGLLALLGD
ncbi:helix-turn-helix transcriptional regulator [Lysobacter sp. SG-8]|uniref:Helix-turn-helix transcriptional regulator n=1 Tax=Marilutibacter penaei TaxID=2759900 RepID=A0A7W3U472_9GAMM|nr:helix-turn-helix transcriptional regulator [Lysobacter penaei]MBB1088639.1 helix-turn-helix transcriptional regulator [Lysobacter penaei]